MRNARILKSALLALVFIAAGAAAAGPARSDGLGPLPGRPQADPSGPGPRSGHRMVYDEARGVAVIFGGWSAAEKYLGDTWVWNGASWTQKTAAGPSPRAWYGMAYDTVKKRTLLFGGRNAAGEAMGDTWEWNGESWRRLSAAGPTPRDHTGLAFDPGRGTFILYGGYELKTEKDFFDTWEWNGSWRKAAEGGPDQAAAHAMAYDGTRGAIVLFGGLKGEDAVAATWLWNGSRWTLLPTPPVEGRTHTALTASPDGEGLIRFGGKNTARTPFGDTWKLRSAAWSRLSESGPPARIDHAAAYDSRRKRIVLHGGKLPSPDKTRFGDTWEWDGRRWEKKLD